MDSNRMASATAKRWLTNPTEAPPELQVQDQQQYGLTPVGGDSQVTATYRTPFAEYHQVMSSRDDAGFTWVQKMQASPANTPEDVQWLNQARQQYSDSYLRYLNGEISYEKFVLDNFEEDVWRMQGYDFANPAFWYKRYMQNDFTDPRNNTAMRFSVLSEAIKFAQTMSFEDFLYNTNSTTNNLLRSLDGQLTDIAGRPITEQTVETLLGEDWQRIKGVFEGDVERALKYVRSSGAEVQRLFYNDENGEPSWYLHTDGKLYKVKPYDGRRQAGYASYKGTAENPTEIWIDDNNLFGLGWAAGDAFASSLAGFALTLSTMFAQIPALAIDTVEGLATGDWTFDKVANVALFFQDIQESNMITARGRIDLDGFQWGSMADWGDTVGSFAGTMVGMIATAKFGGFLAGGSTATSGAAAAGAGVAKAKAGTGAVALAAGKSSPLKVIGNFLNKVTNVYSGGGLKAKGAAQVASFATDAFGKALGARTTFAVTFALKDGFNVLTQRTLVNDPEAFQKAALVTAVNSAITMALGSTKADDTAYFYQRMFKIGQRQVTDPATIDAASRLFGRSLFTAGLDLFDNYFTMSLAASAANRGTMEIDWDPSRAIYATLMARNAFVGAQKSGQFISNRIPGTVLRDLQADAERGIQNARTAQERSDAILYRDAIVREIDEVINGKDAGKPEGRKQLATGQAYWEVLNNLKGKFKGTPLEEGFNRMLEGTLKAENDAFFKDMLAEGEALYDSYLEAEQGFVKRLFLYGFRNTDGTGRGAFREDFVKEVYDTIAQQTKQYAAINANIRSVDDVSKMILDLYGERPDFNSEDFTRAAEFLDINYVNGRIQITLKGMGTKAQGDLNWTRTQQILMLAEKYGVLMRYDENIPDQFILRAPILKDIELPKGADSDENAAEVKRQKKLKQKIMTNYEKSNLSQQELEHHSMSTLMYGVTRLRHTIEAVVTLARKDKITKRDIENLKEAMGRSDASTEEILQDLHINGFISGSQLFRLIGEIGKKHIKPRSYMWQAYQVFELQNQARENPDVRAANMRKIESIIAKANSGDDNLKSLLDQVYGEGFTQSYREILKDLFSQQAASDISGTIKAAFDEAKQEFKNDQPIRFSFEKEDGNIKNLSEVATELRLDTDGDLYKELEKISKNGSFKKGDLNKLFSAIINNADQLPRRVVLSAAQGKIANIFREGVTYANERKVQVNLATIVTKTQAEIFEYAGANEGMDPDSVINAVAGRNQITPTELIRMYNEEVESLNLLRSSYPDQSMIEVSDIERVLGPLGYGEDVFDKNYIGITALDVGEVLVEIKSASYSKTLPELESYTIENKTNKQSAVLERFGGTRQIDESSTFVQGAVKQFLEILTKDINLRGQTIRNIETKAKGQTLGGAKGANLDLTYDIKGKDVAEQVDVVKYVFLKNLVTEMSEGEYARGLATYVTPANEAEIANYARFWTVSEVGDGRIKLTDFKGVDDLSALNTRDVKYVVPLELRDEDVITFRSRANDMSLRMNFLPDFKYGTFSEENIMSGPSDNTVHKLITSYLKYADATQKEIIIEQLLRPYAGKEVDQKEALFKLEKDLTDFIVEKIVPKKTVQIPEFKEMGFEGGESLVWDTKDFSVDKAYLIVPTVISLIREYRAGNLGQRGARDRENIKSLIRKSDVILLDIWDDYMGVNRVREPHNNLGFKLFQSDFIERYGYEPPSGEALFEALRSGKGFPEDLQADWEVYKAKYIGKIVSTFDTKEVLEAIVDVDNKASQIKVTKEAPLKQFGLFDENIGIRSVARNADGTVQEPTIQERNIYKLARMEGSIKNDADKVLVELAKHFVATSKEETGEVERLATDPLFRQILDEDQTNDPEVIAAAYEARLEEARQSAQLSIDDSDFEKSAGAFVNVVLEHKFEDLVGSIQKILLTIQERDYNTRIVYNQSSEDAFLESNVIEMNGKKYLPVKSLINAPEEIFDRIRGGENARQKYNDIKELVGEEQPESIRLDMKSRDFPTQIMNRAKFVYGTSDEEIFKIFFDNSKRNAAIRGLQNANLDETKPRSPLEYEKTLVDLIDKNEFYNEAVEKIPMNQQQQNVLPDVFDRFNSPSHPNFVVVLKDGTIFDANNMEYRHQGNHRDNSLHFEYLTRKAENPNAFDGAVIFTADNISKSFYTNNKISGASFDTKITDLLSEDVRNSFGKYIVDNNENLDLLDFEKVQKDPKLQKELEQLQARWLARRAARTVTNRFWFDTNIDLEETDLRNELFKIIDQTVFDRDKTVDNLAKLYFDQQINQNDKGIKSVMGFLTDGVPINDLTVVKSNEVVDRIIQEARTIRWIADANGEEIIKPETFDYFFDIIDNKTRTLLTEFNSERLNQRRVTNASTLNIPGIVRGALKTPEVKSLINARTNEKIQQEESVLGEKLNKKQQEVVRSNVTEIVQKELTNWLDSRVGDLIALSALKNSVDDGNNVINSNAVRLATKLGYNLENARRDFRDGVQLKQTEDKLLLEFKTANKVYIDSEYYTINGKRKYVSVAFVGDDGVEERFFFKTVDGKTPQEQMENLRRELRQAGLPSSVRKGIEADYREGINNPNRRFDNVGDAQRRMQEILNRYSIDKKGMVLAHGGRDAEFKDLVGFLNLDLKNIRLEDTAEFAALFRKIGPESTLSNSLEALYLDYESSLARSLGLTRHTAFADALATKEIIEAIIKEFDGYSRNRFEGGRTYSDLEKVLRAFETGSFKFNDEEVIKETNRLLEEIKSIDPTLTQDRGPVATTKTFVQLNNLIRELSVQRSGGNISRAYERSLERYNLSPVSEETRIRLNSLSPQGRNDLKAILNYLSSEAGQKQLKFLSKYSKKEKGLILEPLNTLLRYDYEVANGKFLSPDEVLQRLTSTDLVLKKLNISKETLDEYYGSKINPIYTPEELREVQQKLQRENQFHSTFEKGFDFIFKGLNVNNKDALRNLIMAPIFDMFAKDLSQGETFSDEGIGVLPKPVNKKFVKQMKDLLDDYGMKGLNKIEVSIDTAEGTSEGPFKNLAPHRESYKLTGESSYKDIKANEAFISREMLKVMLSSVANNRRANYIFRDNKGEYIWSKMYINPGDNPGKFMAIKMYIHDMDKSTNVEFDQTLLKMLARDTDGDKVGFVPVSKKSKELIEGYEFASKAQFDSLNELKSIVNELRELTAPERQRLAIEENKVLQYIKGIEEGIDFTKKNVVNKRFGTKLGKELFDWHKELVSFDADRTKAKDVSLLFKLSKDVQLAGEMRKLAIARHKEAFLKDLPSVKEQLDDPELLLKSIQLPIILDDDTVEVLAAAESLNSEKVQDIKSKYKVNSLFELANKFNSQTIEFAGKAENNTEFQRLLANAVEARGNRFNEELKRLENIYSQYIGPSESAYISKGGDYNERISELEKLYDQVQNFKDIRQSTIDPTAPVAFKTSRVNVFVSSEIPSDSRFTNSNYKFNERIAGIKDQILLTSTDQIQFKFEANKEVAISKGQPLVIDKKETIRSNVDGYARVFVEDGEPAGIIVYEAYEIGPETKISVVNSAVGKTIGISLSEATKPDGSADEDIAHFLSLNTFKTKKIADIETINGFKLVEGDSDNLVTRTINGKEYKGVILEVDTALLEDTNLWADSNARQIDQMGFFNNIETIFGRLEFAGDDIRGFIDLMDTNSQPRQYQGADATNTVWTMSVFAPLKLLNDAQRAEFFRSLNKEGFDLSKDQFLTMYNTGHMLRESIEDILGRPLKDVTIEEVESMLKKEVVGFKGRSRDDQALLNLVWKSINGDLINLENNYETLYMGFNDPDSTISKRVRESAAAEGFNAFYSSPLREAAGTFIDDQGRQIKVPMYRTITTTDIADEIGAYIDFDKFLYLMENNKHRPQNAYTDISTGFKPVNKDSLVFDERANAISEEFYKTYPATLEPGELRMRARSPMNFEEFNNIRGNLPAYTGEIRGIEKPGEKASFNEKIKFLLQASYDALEENPENLGMVTRLRSSQLLPVEGEAYVKDPTFDRPFYDDLYMSGYGFLEDENGRNRMDSIPNRVQIRTEAEKKNFGRTALGNQNQMREDFFVQRLMEKKNYFTPEEIRESLRLAADDGKPLKVEIPDKFFEGLESSKVYDEASLNIRELENDLKILGYKSEDNDDIVNAFMMNRERGVVGTKLDLELERALMPSAGIRTDSPDRFQIERMIQMFNNDSRTVLRSLTRNLTAIESLLGTKRNKQEFQRYYVFKYFDIAKEAEMNPALKAEIEQKFGTKKSIEQIRKDYIAEYEAVNKTVVEEYVKLLENMFVLSREVFTGSNLSEPIADPIRLLYPSFVEKDDPTKNSLKGTLINKTVSAIEMKSFDPSTLEFDPFKAIQIYANKISKKIALDKLADRSKEMGLTDNVKTVNLAREFAEREILNNPNHTRDVKKAIDFLDTELVNRFGYIYQRYVELIDENMSGQKESDALYVRSRLDAIETLIDETMAATQDAVTNSSFAKSANFIDKNYESLDRLENEIRDMNFSRMVDPLKGALLLRDQFYGTLASVRTETKFIDFLKQRLPNVRITDEYMRSIESDMFVKPYDTLSLEYIKTSLTNANRPLLLRALEGRVYATNKDFADHLGKYFFTTKPSNKFVQWMSRYSNLAVKFIMGNPLKLLERIEYFTATDLYMLTNANPFAISKIGRARKELTGYQFARPSEADPEYSDVRKFLQLIGNDAGSARRADFYTRNQELEPTKLDNPITDKTLDFIEIQNNLTRYALYLQTLEDLEKYGQIKYYGNAYVNKEGIDQFKTNEEKAWGVVSSNIPLFGDLPFILRYTTPWLVFASFPLAQARHLGEWVKSYHKVIKDDVLRNDPKEFMRNAAMPAGVLGLEMFLAQMLISAVADMYNVDEETEERWKKDDSFISIFQTMFFDKPTVRQGSANPYRIVYDNLIGTAQQAATDRRTGELRDDWLTNIPLGYFNAQVLSRLNPTLKIPLEVISEKDFYGTDYRSAPYDLNYMQNMLRKVGGYVIGTQSARAITDSLALHRYQPEERSLLYSIIQGFTNGVADEFGNSKTYKRDIKDFYAARSIIYGHLNGVQDTNYANSIVNFNDIINSETRFQNSNYNAEQVNEVSELLRTALFREEDISVVYNILLEKLDQGYSPSTLNAAVNRISVSRIIERIPDPEIFWESLTQKERSVIENGLAYEKRIFPMLNEINLFASSARSTNNFTPRTLLPFNQHRYMPYQNNYYRPNEPQRSKVFLYQNMGTFNPRYMPNTAYERWVKR